jgi:hypothetical protein
MRAREMWLAIENIFPHPPVVACLILKDGFGDLNADVNHPLTPDPLLLTSPLLKQLLYKQAL